MGGDDPQERPAPLPPQIAALRRQAQRSGVLLDYDGTLAPIVNDPALARPLPGSRTVLRSLVGRYRLVAVVSGRPAAFLAAHLDVPGLVRLGSYGLEEVTSSGVVESPAATPWRPAVAGVVRRARESAPDGVLVEDKGLSLTLHHRTAPESAAWVHAFAGAEAAATGLAAFVARQSVELRPPVAVDKGSAVASLLDRSAVVGACFCGDDIGDLPAFQAIAPLPVALRVAVRSDETPVQLLDAADYVVDGPHAVLALLRALAA